MVQGSLRHVSGAQGPAGPKSTTLWVVCGRTTSTAHQRRMAALDMHTGYELQRVLIPSRCICVMQPFRQGAL
jgi:hypothetical protein